MQELETARCILGDMEEKEYLYDAFISYRHAPLDSWVAGLLHKKLETYKLPKEMQKQLGRKGISRVFRDHEELMSNPSLANELEQAVSNSKYLILICSLQTLKSEWVLHEVETFIRLRDKEHILLLLVEGKSIDIIPPVLKYREKRYTLENGQEVTVKEEVQPLAADIRGKDKREMRQKLSTEILRLISPILGCRFDDLKQRHKERTRRKMIAIAAVLGMGLIGFSTFNAWRVEQINTQMNAKLATQSRALADQAERLLERGDRMKALLVALEALPKNMNHPERPLMEQVSYALSKALYSYEFGLKMLPDRTLEYSNILEEVHLSPEGTKAATISSNGGLQIWDMEKASLVKEMEGNQEPQVYTKIEFLDESHLLVLKNDILECLNAETGEMLWKKAYTYSNDFKISPDGAKVVVSDLDHLMVVDVMKGDEMKKVNFSKMTCVKQVAWSQDGQYIALGGFKDTQGIVEVFDWAKEKKVNEWRLDLSSINQIMFEGNDQLIVTTTPYHESLMDDLIDNGQAKMIKLKMNGQTLLPVWTRQVEKSRLTQFKLDKTGERILTSGENILYMIKTSDGSVEKQYTGSSPIVGYKIVGDLAYCGFEDGSVKAVQIGDTFSTADIDFKHEGGNTSFDFAGGRAVLTSKLDKKIYIYRALCGKEKAFNENDQYIYDLKEGTTGKVFYSTYQKNQANGVMIWDSATKEKICDMVVESSIKELGFVNEDTAIYILGGDDILRFYDTKTGKCLKEIEPKKNAIDVSVWEGTGKNLYLCDQESLMVVDVAKMEVTKELSDEDRNIIKLKEMGEDIVLTLNKEGQIRKINLQSGKVTKLLEGISDFEIEPDENRIAVYNEEGKIEVWDDKTGKKKWQFEAEGSKLTYMTFEPGENRLWACYEDTTIYEYDLKKGKQETFQEELNAEAVEIRFYPKEKKMAVITGTSKYNEAASIYRKMGEGYRKLADVSDIEDISQKGDAFYITGFAGRGYRVPFYSAEELKEEALETVGDQSLTEKEKRQWFISE